MPRFSVVVPVYQAEKFIEKCVRSVLEQTFTDWELILVDDGSRDRSGEICDNFAGFDDRITVIHQPNGGVSAARNAGMDRASGEYIAFLDSDDFFLPGMLEKMDEAISETGCDSVGCCHMNVFSDGRQEYESLGVAPGRYSGEELSDAIVRPLLRDRVEGERPLNGYVWRFCYSREIVMENGIRFSGAYLEDELFLIEFFSIADELVVLGDALYGYYPNENSVTRKYLPDFVNTFLASFEMKRGLVRQYSITGIDNWEMSTLWAGLLMAIGNINASGNAVSLREKARQMRILCKLPPFSDAVRGYDPKGVTGNKKIVVRLVRLRFFGLLALLYRVKNRKR